LENDLDNNKQQFELFSDYADQKVIDLEPNISIEKKSLNELKLFSDTEIVSYLKRQWDISKNTPIIIFGVISYGYNDNFYWLSEVKSLNTDNFEYPITDIDKIKSTISNGVRVPLLETRHPLNELIKKYIEINTNIYVQGELVLAPKKERDKYKNPLLLFTNPDTLKIIDEITLNIIDEIQPSNILRDTDKNILIEKSIVNYISKKNQSVLEEKYKKDIQIFNELSTRNSKQKEDYSLEKKSYENVIAELQKETTSIDLSIQKKETALNLLNSEAEIMKKQIELDKEERMKQIERFKSYIKDKADTLLKLEFIDENEYNDILMIKKEEDTVDEFIGFHSELEGSFSDAISHIQAYLFNQDIMYPRYILEDYFALIQTNDLIILAGESGSGKTNLIKSFARAVGGKAIIIPVKPNWTSSEDLLGYYNPLEKKYLSTPFLGALLEANRNPEVPYFICLDEMNLARVEYYFADFLSLLEERGELPEIHLYSDNESSHILSEFKHVLTLIESSKEKFKKGAIVDFVKILQDEKVNQELKRVFGFSDKDSLIKYHSDLRRMLSGILSTPSSIIFPKNVRIIGAINIDETTHYLSSKILDRAHIMKFDSPLLFDWDIITKEIQDSANVDKKIKFNIDDFGTRKEYPKFDITDNFCKEIVSFTKKYFTQLGVEVGLRTIRQGLNYKKIFLKLNSNDNLALNNFIVHKILPKLVFDGSKKIGEIEKKNLILHFKDVLEETLSIEIKEQDGLYSISELEKIIKKAEANEWIINYWA
jgi:hypothetical protein